MGRRSDFSIVTTAFAVVLFFSFISACAEKGPVLLDGVKYQVPEGSAPATGKAVVAVIPFQDQRGTAASLIGKRTIPDYTENDLVVQGTASDLVTAALKDCLRSRGVTVLDVPVGETAAGPAARRAGLVVGGEIKTLWVDALSRLPIRTQAAVELRVSLAEGPERTVFRTVNLSSKIEREDMAFSFETLQDALSEALTAALNQLLADDEFSKRIK